MQLPTDLLSRIFTFLEPETVLTCFCVSSEWYNAANSTDLWYQYCIAAVGRNQRSDAIIQKLHQRESKIRNKNEKEGKKSMHSKESTSDQTSTSRIYAINSPSIQTATTNTLNQQTNTNLVSTDTNYKERLHDTQMNNVSNKKIQMVPHNTNEAVASSSKASIAPTASTRSIAEEDTLTTVAKTKSNAEETRAKTKTNAEGTKEKTKLNAEETRATMNSIADKHKATINSNSVDPVTTENVSTMTTNNSDTLTDFIPIKNSWRQIFPMIPTVRTNGIYTLRTEYFRRGYYDMFHPTGSNMHKVVFHRSFWFRQDGIVLCATLPGSSDIAMHAFSRFNQAIRDRSDGHEYNFPRQSRDILRLIRFAHDRHAYILSQKKNPDIHTVHEYQDNTETMEPDDLTHSSDIQPQTQSQVFDSNDRHSVAPPVAPFTQNNNPPQIYSSDRTYRSSFDHSSTFDHGGSFDHGSLPSQSRTSNYVGTVSPTVVSHAISSFDQVATVPATNASSAHSHSIHSSTTQLHRLNHNLGSSNYRGSDNNGQASSYQTINSHTCRHHDPSLFTKPLNSSMVSGTQTHGRTPSRSYQNQTHFPNWLTYDLAKIPRGSKRPTDLAHVTFRRTSNGSTRRPRGTGGQSNSNVSNYNNDGDILNSLVSDSNMEGNNVTVQEGHICYGIYEIRGNTVLATTEVQNTDNYICRWKMKITNGGSKFNNRLKINSQTVSTVDSDISLIEGVPTEGVSNQMMTFRKYSSL